MKTPKVLLKIVSFITRLNKKEKRLLYCAVGAVLLFGLDRLIVHPITDRTAALNQEIFETETMVRKNTKILALKDRIIDETLKLAPMLNKIDFDEREVSSLLKTLENYAVASEVNLINIKPQGLEERSNWRAYKVSLNCEGRVDQLVRFLYAIENSPHLLLIRRFQVAPRRRGSSIASCTMNIDKIIADKKGGA